MSDTKKKGKKQNTEKFDINSASDTVILRYIIETLFNHSRDDLADRLMLRFGSMRAVFAATHGELMTVAGMTDRAASFFTLAMPSYRRALLNEACKVTISGERELISLVAAYYCTENAPCTHIFCLSGGAFVNAERADDDIVRTAIGAACRYGADSIFAVNYRPYAGGLLPDIKGLETTLKILDATDALGMTFLDSIEYCPYRFLSLRNVLNGEFAEKSVLLATKAKFGTTDRLDKTRLTGLISEREKCAKNVRAI